MAPITEQRAAEDGVCGRLRALRLERGLSVDTMAKRLKVSRTALYRYERGEQPKLGTLQRAADVLAIPLAVLLGEGVEWFGTALGFFERLRQVEEHANHIFVLFGPTSWLLVSDAYADFVLRLIQASLTSVSDADALVEVMRQRRAIYARRRPSLVSVLSLHDMHSNENSSQDARLTGLDPAKVRALQRAEWANVAALAEAPPRGVQLGVLRTPIPSTGFSLARCTGRTVAAVSPFRFGDPMNMRLGAAAVTSEPQAVRLHEAMADDVWEAAVKGAEAASLIKIKLRRRRRHV